LWTNRYHGEWNRQDIAVGVAVDGSDNVIVTGTSAWSRWHDYATIKYSSAGVPLWTNRFDGSGNINDRAKAVAVDRSGNVFVTGALWRGIPSDFYSPSDYVTIKYPSAGGPMLAIARTTTNTLALSWPSPAADFALQQNTNVATTNWVPVGNTPADDGTNKTVIVDPPDGNKFYRLFRP
jgi:hypothetical protein